MALSFFDLLQLHAVADCRVLISSATYHSQFGKKLFLNEFSHILMKPLARRSH